MNCGDLIACPSVIPDCGSSCAARTTFSEFNAGGRRTSNRYLEYHDRGECREDLEGRSPIVLEMSRAANGDMVIGAIPMRQKRETQPGYDACRTSLSRKPSWAQRWRLSHRRPPSRKSAETQ